MDDRAATNDDDEEAAADALNADGGKSVVIIARTSSPTAADVADADDDAAEPRGSLLSSIRAGMHIHTYLAIHMTHVAGVALRRVVAPEVARARPISGLAELELKLSKRTRQQQQEIRGALVGAQREAFDDLCARMRSLVWGA